MKLARGLALAIAVILFVWLSPTMADPGPKAADQPAGQGGAAEPTAAQAKAPAQADETPKPEAPAETEPAAKDKAAKEAKQDPLTLLNADKLQWYNEIQTLALGPMTRGTTTEYREAEDRLLAITDPNALEPMALVLYTPNTRWRSTFVKSATQYARCDNLPTSQLAVTYLSDVAVRDPSGILRGKARAALLHPETPRYPERLKYQLTHHDDAMVRSRAAGLLADIKNDSMLETMIELLTTEEWRLKGAWVETRSVHMDIRASNAQVGGFTPVPVQAAVPGMVATATIQLPNVHVSEINTTVSAPAGARIDYDWELVTVKHGGMLSALERLTGKKFGYNKDAWRAWLAAQRKADGDEGKADDSEPRSRSPYDVKWDTH